MRGIGDAWEDVSRAYGMFRRIVKGLGREGGEGDGEGGEGSGVWE